MLLLLCILILCIFKPQNILLLFYRINVHLHLFTYLPLSLTLSSILLLKHPTLNYFPLADIYPVRIAFNVGLLVVTLSLGCKYPYFDSTPERHFLQE